MSNSPFGLEVYRALSRGDARQKDTRLAVNDARRRCRYLRAPMVVVYFEQLLAARWVADGHGHCCQTRCFSGLEAFSRVGRW